MNAVSIRSLLCCVVLLLVLDNHPAHANQKMTIMTTKPSMAPCHPSTNQVVRSDFNRNNKPSLSSDNLSNFVGFRGGAIFKKKKQAAAPPASKTKNSNLKSAFAKVFIGTTVESVLMHQVLLFAFGLSNEFKDKTFASVVQFLLIFSVVFGSSTYGAVIDNGLSAATQQFLSPNEVPGDSDWYSKLQKPSWNPPGWVFPIMWLIISKPTQFVALWKLKEMKMTMTGSEDLALLVYCIHLSLGDAWNKIFFGLQQIKVGVVVISAFWTLLLASTYFFYAINPSAGLFMVPTCLWVTVAASLNWSIYMQN
ncbi:unnamed protein product [Cylindrotheca closterium]|uniref:Tryptophan-rich sensory protein n=1 Tax=Cylindrotheca closterium TaxID=2856 RepID=A0AAD2FP44_9STRA|nr:unnamed protein product [Cylindrotheca closterium]